MSDKKKKPHKALFKKFTNWIRQFSIFKHIFVWYFIITIIGSLMLSTQAAHAIGQKTKYIDNLFVASSAFSDTGLVTVATSRTWSSFGQAVIAVLILFGGLGWFSLKIYIFNIFLRLPSSFLSYESTSTERGTKKIGDVKELVKISISIMLIVIVVFSLILTLYFYLVPGHMSGYDPALAKNQIAKINPNYYGVSAKGDFLLSLRYGIFHTISALNNSGFDIIGSHSMGGFYHDYGLQIIFIVLFVLGGIGYPVIYETYLWIKSKIAKKIYRWSLFSKLSCIAYFTVMILSLVTIFATEITAKGEKVFASDGKMIKIIPSFWNNPNYGSKNDKVMALFFNTLSTRNAGFSTINVANLSQGSKILYSSFMFIGSAPSSTGGGIRTTTLAIVFLGLVSLLRGRSKILIFNRKVPQSTVTRSYIVFVTAASIVLVSTLILMTSLNNYGGVLNSSPEHMSPAYIEPGTARIYYLPYNYTSIFFEVSSAFGTTGLSTGITANLSAVSKVFLIFVMFIGQLGVSSSILAWQNKKRDVKNYSYIEEDLSVG